MNKEMLHGEVISYDDGIRKFAGNERLYEKYLTKFLKDDHYDQAMEALSQKDYKNVLEQTHALKGIAGTLGMIPYFEACNEVVTAIRQDRSEEVECLMKTVTDCRAQVLEILEKAL